jgi:exopolysaccharide production protein ExoZ
MAMQGQFFAGIQGLRLVAAFAVLIARAVFVADHGHTGPAAVRLGRIGVILFFAISGFVIALQRHKPVGEFIMLRFLRIYPPYWIALALEGALFATVGLPVGATADAVCCSRPFPKAL